MLRENAGTAKPTDTLSLLAQYFMWFLWFLPLMQPKLVFGSKVEPMLLFSAWIGVQVSPSSLLLPCLRHS